MAFTQETAEVMALRAFGWLVSNDDLMPVFQSSTGASKTDVRAGATDPTFLGSVLDFIMMDDAWVVQCCDALDIPYDALMHVRAVLPGGEQVNWT